MSSTETGRHVEKASSVSLTPLCEEISDHFLAGKFNPCQLSIVVYFVRYGYVAPRYMEPEEWDRLARAKRFNGGPEWSRKCRNDLTSLGLMLESERGKLMAYTINPNWESPAVRAAAGIEEDGE